MDFTKSRRILYKISGELLSSDHSPICEERVQAVADEFVRVQRLGHELIVVCGAGNIMRGRSARGAERASVDAAGMISTYVNALMLHGCVGDVPCAIFGTDANAYVQAYNFTMCVDALQSGHMVFLVGGSGLPYFSTDTLAAVRARQLRCDVIVKGTSVDGVYTADPKKDTQAMFVKNMTYTRAIDDGLGFMDTMAFSILRSSPVKTCVFNRQKHTLDDLILGKDIKCSFVQEVA